jgi:hypothetical protein
MILKTVLIMIPKLLVTEKSIWSPKPRATTFRMHPMPMQMNPMIQVGVKKTDLLLPADYTLLWENFMITKEAEVKTEARKEQMTGNKIDFFSSLFSLNI